MTVCPECQHPVPFTQLYRMLTRLVDTDRCRACDIVFTLDTPTRVAQGFQFVLFMAFSGYFAFVEQLFGIELTADNRFYYFCAFVVLFGLIGNLPIAWQAGVRGPVPSRICPRCDYDLTGEGGLRCSNCLRMIPASIQPFIHRLGVWVFPLFAVAGIVWLLLGLD